MFHFSSVLFPFQDTITLSMLLLFELGLNRSLNRVRPLFPRILYDLVLEQQGEMVSKR